MTKLTMGSLFSGIGGIEKGFQKAGTKIIWANDNNKEAIETYKLNFSHNVYLEDINDFINKIEANPAKFRVDILTAGFPCQSFSIAGERKGFKDERGNLFFSIIKIAKLLKPKVIFLENVRNLNSHDKGKTIEIIKKSIVKNNYTYNDYILNTVEYGNLPQNRERIYIICVNKSTELFKEKEFNNEKLSNIFKINRTKLTKNIGDILINDKVDDDYYYSKKHKYYKKMKKEIVKTDTVYQWRRVYIRENKNNVCPTLTANMGTGGHNIPIVKDKYGIRKLTPKECARLQGFKDEYIFPENIARSHIYKQIGNSVSVPVINRLAKKITKFLNDNKSI